MDDDLTAEVLRQSEQFVDITKTAFSLELDYTEASIAKLDDIFEEIRGELSEDGVHGTAMMAGCYIGEVARKSGLGNWIDGSTEDIPEIMRQPVLFKVSNEKGTITDPIAWVGKRLMNGEEDNIAFKFGLMGSDTPFKIFQDKATRSKKKGFFKKLFGK